LRARVPTVVVPLNEEEVRRLEYAAGYASQGPLGDVDGALLRRLERWERRGEPVRARLDGAVLRALLALAPLYGGYRERKRDTVPLYFRAAPPADDAAATLEAKLREALGRLER
jgi:hypothetical protein